ncbi:hypothetical protein IFVP5_C210116 [Vibrio parahaemolyticus]
MNLCPHTQTGNNKKLHAKVEFSRIVIALSAT